MESDHQQYQREYNRAMRDLMDMAVHPAMGAAAQGSVLTSTGTGGSIFGQYPGHVERRVESMFDHNRQVSVKVVTADNGFIVVVKPDMPGATERILVATSVDEVRDLITSEMVSRKMEK